MKAPSGFTLIELMVSLSVAAILLTVGVPGFQEFIKANSLNSRVNSFVADLNLARSEAIKRSGRVTMCKSSTLTSCTNAGGWEQGWIIFFDPDGDRGVLDPNTNDKVIRTASPMSGNITIRGNSNVANNISFLSSGFVHKNSIGSFIFCDDRIKAFSSDKVKAKAVVISFIGRVRTTSGDKAPDSISSCLTSAITS